MSIAMAQATGAVAIVTPNVTTTLSDTQLGAHADLNVRMDFDYGATGTVEHSMLGLPDVVQDPYTYPPGSDYRENVESLVVDTPPGLVGNPNAIPFEQRCDVATFESLTELCPDSATVGEFKISTTLTGLEPEEAPTEPGAGYISIDFGTTGIAGAFTKVSLLKTSPEVPAQIGVLVQPPFSFRRIHTVMQVAPDTNGDLRLRTTTPGGIDNLLFSGSTGDPLIHFRINWMELTLLGNLPNGNAFMTNSTSCEKWTSKIWAKAAFVNSNLDSDPLGTGELFKAGNESTITPDCTNQTAIPFPARGTTTVSSDKRDVSPDFDFTVYNPGVQANGQVSTSPRKVVTRVPASINVDIQQLSRTCHPDLFDADQCPASTRVGTVAIETPLIVAGLSGDVYLVRRIGGGLPDLGLRIRGAISFTQRGENHYVGPNGNEIETTFDNIPQVGFSKLNVHLFGGADGLLRTLPCPTGNKQPAIGDFQYYFTSYTGASTSSRTKLSQANCFGIQKLRSFKCVYRVLRFQPTYTSRARIKRVVLKVDGKKVSTAKRAPFQFKVPAKRFKKGKHKFELAATYDDGTVSKKKSRFKRC